MIAVIGLGFVGLTTALGFASKGLKVYGFDADVKRRQMLQRGEVPFFEPNIPEQLKQQLSKNFILAPDFVEAIAKAEFIFFCVGTPAKPDGSSDLSYLAQAVKDAAQVAGKDSGKIFIIKSTVPPGTASDYVGGLLKAQGLRLPQDIGLANNPEFLREGCAWKDFIQPDRVVIGSEDEQTAQKAGELYKDFGAPVFYTKLNTAEFIKYTSNALLATMISFSNEMSLLADAFGGIDVPQAFKIVHKDRRWFGQPAAMSSYVFPGCGFGGSCLPKDVKALVAQAKQKNAASLLLETVLKVNESVKHAAARKIMNVAQPQDTIGILGLAFKPDTDDVRQSPSADIIKILLDNGYSRIVAYDPMAAANFAREHGLAIEYAPSLDALLERVSVTAILTAWKEFAGHQGVRAAKNILDFRHVLI